MYICSYVCDRIREVCFHAHLEILNCEEVLYHNEMLVCNADPDVCVAIQLATV